MSTHRPNDQLLQSEHMLPGAGGTVRDPARLAALRRTALLDTPAEDNFDRIARVARAVTDAPVSLVSLVDEDRQFFKSCIGLIEPWASRRQTPLTHSFCQHVVISGKPLKVRDAREDPVLKENLAVPDLSIVAYLGMPLTTSDGYILGTLSVIDDEPRDWSDAHQAALGDLAALAMREIELRLQQKEAEQTRDWLGFLAEASVILASSLDLHQTLAKIPQLVVPRLADWCLVYTKEKDGSITRVALEHRDPIDPRFLEELATFKLDPDAREGVSKVFRTGRPELVPNASPELFAADVDDPARLASLLRPLGVSSWMCVPLWARGAVIGAISFVGDAHRRYGPEQLRLAEDLVRRAALALDNARLFDELRSRGSAPTAPDGDQSTR